MFLYFPNVACIIGFCLICWSRCCKIITLIFFVSTYFTTPYFLSRSNDARCQYFMYKPMDTLREPYRFQGQTDFKSQKTSRTINRPDSENFHGRANRLKLKLAHGPQSPIPDHHRLMREERDLRMAGREQRE